MCNENFAATLLRIGHRNWGRRRESFFGCAVILASDQKAWLVPPITPIHANVHPRKLTCVPPPGRLSPYFPKGWEEHGWQLHAASGEELWLFFRLPLEMMRIVISA